MKRIAILQSNYIPWKGYFDLMASVDEFIIYDTADYTKNDWRNRNQVKTADGPKWLSIPVNVKGKGRQPIDAVTVVDDRWAPKHLATIRQAYARAPHMGELEPLLDDCYARAARCERLHDINLIFLHAVATYLGIDTPLIDARDHPVEGGPSERLALLCQRRDATHYVSGPAAQAYLEAHWFAEADIALEYFSYAGYEPHPQLHGDFTHTVSILDPLLMLGKETNDLLRGGGLVPHA
jgi:hypothetical protein